MSRPLKLVRITTVPLSLKYLLGGQLEHMTKFYEVTAISSPGKELDELEARGLSVLAVPMTRKITPLSDLRALLWLLIFFRKHRPDIVHTHTPKAGLLGMLAARLARVPVRLHTVAGLPLLERPHWQQGLLGAMERLTYSLADKVLPNSKGLEDIILRKKWCSPSKMQVLANGSSNGVDMDFFDAHPSVKAEAEWIRKSLRITERNFIFLFIGRVVKDKGVEELVQAFELLHQQHPQVRLIIVGPQEQDLNPVNERTLQTIHSHPAIIRTGFKEDVRPYLHLSQALVLPTYREGFPNVLMQAGCFGLPCIATDINGCNEVIVHELNGLLIAPKSMSALLKAMYSLLENKQTYEKMRQNARPLIVDKFRQGVVWDALRNCYEKELAIRHQTEKKRGVKWP
jgi:glycosyltransferase involved in cell wall biosynthesis